MRGSRRGLSNQRIRVGTIPAHAGKPVHTLRIARQCGDYPRACGEARFFRSNRQNIQGLSPRMRGSRVSTSALTIAIGTIPAHAGKPRPATRP